MTILSSTGETRVNTYMNGSQSLSRVVPLPDGGWLIVWQSAGQDGSSEGVFQQRFDAKGYAVGPETQVNTYTPSHQRYPSVTLLEDGGWIVAWTSWEQDGSKEGVFQQRYDSEGKAQFLGPDGSPMDVRISVATTWDQSSPHVMAMSDGGWIATWQEWVRSPSTGVMSWDLFQQRFDRDGNALFRDGQGQPVDMMVNTRDSSTQWQPQTIELADGGWLVVWTSNDDFNVDGMDIYWQRYAPDGTRVGGETRISATADEQQSQATITALRDGGWIVTWTHGINYGAENEDRDIRSQRFSADGTRVGDEVHVNTTTAGFQMQPEIVALNDGGWVVVWMSQSAGQWDVFQQHYDAEGRAVGGEVRVNSLSAHDQIHADVAALADGGWIVTWTSGTGHENDIHQQRYNSFGQAIGPTTPTGINLSAALVKEGTPAGTSIGSLSAAVLDPTQPLTFTLLDDAGGRFDLVSGLGVTKLVVEDGTKLDYEQARSHWIQVRAEDVHGGRADAWFRISVADVAEERLTGGTRADVLKGGKAKDTFSGGAGNDRLWGGLGNDQLKGGSGKDVFVFSTKANSRTNKDKILDFRVKDDTIWLENKVFTKLGKSGSEKGPAKLKKDFFTIGTKAEDRNDHLIYDKKKGVLLYDADGSGKGRAVEIASLSKKLKITEKDFYII